MSRALVWTCALFALVQIGNAETVRTAMNSANPSKINLARQISIPNREAAEMTARSMSADDVGDVLKDEAGDDKASARMEVLDLASKYPSEGASRAILSRLSDSNLTVQSIANSLITAIAQKNLVPEILRTMGLNLGFDVKGALARQVGMIGDVQDIPRLRTIFLATVDGGLRHDLSLAMARLGDESSRSDLISRLAAQEVQVRLAALQDTLYVGDRRFARYFRPAIEDQRDVIIVSMPHDPTVWARVCDVAIQTLAGLGMKLSFDTVPTRQFTEAEIREALQTVMTFANTQ
jgi:HEAT repeat protein